MSKQPLHSFDLLTQHCRICGKGRDEVMGGDRECYSGNVRSIVPAIKQHHFSALVGATDRQ